jgi:Outer membrane protein beta-barrel domain
MEGRLSKSVHIRMRIKRTAPTFWMQPTWNRKPGRSKGHIAAMVCSVVVLLGCASAAAQTSPRIQVFGGYSYLRFDSPTLGFANASGLNGFTVMAAFNINRRFGIVGEAGANYGSKLNVRNFVFGPQFLWPRGRMLLFAHGLWGRARAQDSVGATTLTDTGNTFEGGGGVDWNLTQRFSIRVIQADYTYTKFFQQNQSNLRFSTGLVFHLGALKRKPHRAPSEPVP